MVIVLKKLLSEKEVYSEKRLTYCFRIKSILFLVIAYFLALYSLLEYDSLPFENFLLTIFAVTCCLAMFIYSLFAYNRKKLILDTQQLIFSCNNDNNLCDLINHYDSAQKNIKKAKRLLTFGKDKRILESYLHTLVNSEQHYVRKILHKNYQLL